VEKFDRMFTFDPKSGSMVTAGSSIPTDLVPAVAATLPIITATEAGLPERSLMHNDSNNWSPRIGLAFRPFNDTSTVLRAGFGVYAQFWPGLLGLNQTGGPWQSTESFFLEDPNTPSIQFPTPFETTSAFSGIQSISGVSARFPNETTYQWNLSSAPDLGHRLASVTSDRASMSRSTRTWTAVSGAGSYSRRVAPPAVAPTDPDRRLVATTASPSGDRRMAGGLVQCELHWRV
jgi:hypothetical protein